MARGTENLVTQAAYARSRKDRGLPGGTRKAVHAAVRDGAIDAFGPDKLIDPELADRQWAKNRRARVGASPAGGQAQAQTPIEAAAGAPGEAAAAAPAPTPAPAADTGYSAARTRREVAEAETAEIELRRKKGELVLREDVDRAFREIMREIRDRLMATAKRTAAEVSAMTSAAACEEVIDREHRIVLELLVQSFREKVGAPPSEVRG